MYVGALLGRVVKDTVCAAGGLKAVLSFTCILLCCHNMTAHAFMACMFKMQSFLMIYIHQLSALHTRVDMASG